MILRTDTSRLYWLHISACVFLAIGIWLSFPLWNSQRLFPLCPVVDGFPVLPATIELIFPFVMLALLFVGAVYKKRLFTIIGFAFLIFLLLQDQLRWQPWVYMYACLFVPFLLKKQTPETIFSFVQILLIGVYFWSGIHKIGPGFINESFDGMLGALFFIDDPETRAQLHFLGYLIPLFEILIAVGFLFKKTRAYACIGALLTHITILAYLIIEGHNSIVYPWNIAMIVLVGLVFWKSNHFIRFSGISELPSKLLVGAAVVFYLFMPALNFVGMWDNYLSFKLYSGNTGQFCVRVSAQYAGDVDPKLQPYFWRVDDPENSYWIYLCQWGFDELNVPMYPEERILKQVGRTFCALEIPKEEMEFVRFMEGFSPESARRFSCADCE